MGNISRSGKHQPLVVHAEGLDAALHEVGGIKLDPHHLLLVDEPVDFVDGARGVRIDGTVERHPVRPAPAHLSSDPQGGAAVTEHAELRHPMVDGEVTPALGEDA